MSNDSNVEEIGISLKMFEKYALVLNKLSEFRSWLNQIHSSRVSRTRGVACSLYIEQPLRACLVLRTVQCWCLCVVFITYGYFNP